MSNDPVTNALTLQMEMGDDELRKAVEDRIREIALSEVHKYICDMYDPGFVMRYERELRQFVMVLLDKEYGVLPRGALYSRTAPPKNFF